MNFLGFEWEHRTHPNLLFYSDIAIITLRAPRKFDLTPKVRPVCLPYGIQFQNFKYLSAHFLMSGKWLLKIFKTTANVSYSRMGTKSKSTTTTHFTKCYRKNNGICKVL